MAYFCPLRTPFRMSTRITHTEVPPPLKISADNSNVTGWKTSFSGMQSQSSGHSLMYRCKRLFRVVAAALLLCGMHALAQQPGRAYASRGGAQGELTVTATVVSSVGLMIGQNGEQRITIANAVDAKDNVSRLQPVVTVKLMPVDASAKTRPTPKPRKK